MSAVRITPGVLPDEVDDDELRRLIAEDEAERAEQGADDSTLTERGKKLRDEMEHVQPPPDEADGA